jgi:hypothetical protein
MGPSKPPELLTDLERAARFLYLQKLAFGGKARSLGRFARYESLEFRTYSLGRAGGGGESPMRLGIR